MPTKTRHENPVISTEALERALEPEHVLAALGQFGVLEQDIARVTGTHHRTVRRWKVAAPGTRPAQHLAELRLIIVELRLSDVATDRGILFWLRQPNRLLHGWAPLDVIGAGGYHPVLEAARSYINPRRVKAMPLPQAVLDQLEGVSGDPATGAPDTQREGAPGEVVGGHGRDIPEGSSGRGPLVPQAG